MSDPFDLREPTLTADGGPMLRAQAVYVGGYEIGGPLGLRVNFQKRPPWIARFFCRMLLDWRWVDTP